MRIEPLEPRMLLSAIPSNGTELHIALDSTEVVLAFAVTSTGDVSIVADGTAVGTFAPDAVAYFENLFHFSGIECRNLAGFRMQKMTWPRDAGFRICRAGSLPGRRIEFNSQEHFA